MNFGGEMKHLDYYMEVTCSWQIWLRTPNVLPFPDVLSSVGQRLWLRDCCRCVLVRLRPDQSEQQAGSRCQRKWVGVSCWHNCGGRCLNKAYVVDRVVIRQKTDDTHPTVDYPSRIMLSGRSNAGRSLVQIREVSDEAQALSENREGRRTAAKMNGTFLRTKLLDVWRVKSKIKKPDMRPFSAWSGGNGQDLRLVGGCQHLDFHFTGNLG